MGLFQFLRPKGVGFHHYGQSLLQGLCQIGCDIWSVSLEENGPWASLAAGIVSGLQVWWQQQVKDYEGKPVLSDTDVVGQTAGCSLTSARQSVLFACFECMIPSANLVPTFCNGITAGQCIDAQIRYMTGEPDLDNLSAPRKAKYRCSSSPLSTKTVSQFSCRLSKSLKNG